MELPPCFKEDLMNTNMICSNTAEKWIFEYKLFLTMGYTASKTITPSEETDQVWHLHQTYTRHYRSSMIKYLKKHFKHEPTIGGKVQNDLFSDIYTSTLNFYESLFNCHPPDEVWGSSEVRFDPAKFSIRNINLFRMAVMYTVNYVSPEFLILKNENLIQPVKNSDKILDNYRMDCMKVRRNIRDHYIKRGLKYGWRYHYNGTGFYNVCNCDREECDYKPENLKPIVENRHYGYKGPHYLINGGPLFTNEFM